MIIALKPNITKKDEIAVLKEIRKLGYKPHVMRGVERTVIRAICDDGSRGESGWRDDPPGRRFQAAHLPLRIPGPRRKGPQDACQGPQGNWTRGHNRIAFARSCRPDR